MDLIELCNGFKAEIFRALQVRGEIFVFAEETEVEIGEILKERKGVMLSGDPIFVLRLRASGAPLRKIRRAGRRRSTVASPSARLRTMVIP